MIILGVIVGLVYALLVAAVLALVFMPLALLAEWIFENLMPWSRLDETVPTFILTIWVAISLAVGMCAGIPTVMIDTVEWGEPECYVTHEIINLADNNEINGRIHGRYVRGYIGEETTYHYYYERYDGGMDLQKANAKNTIIYYTDDEPHADWYRKSRTYWWNTEYEYSCKIYIPEGTMTTEFTIDME
jgi:hypothetical protein